MQTDGIGAGRPPQSPPPATPAAPATPAPAGGGAFADLLDARIAQTHRAVGGGIAQVRAEIQSIRSGSILRQSPPGAQTGPAVNGADGLPLMRGADGADPYGWRAMTRQLGDALVAPGFGSLFERQIQQESGFLPAVVTGQRRSSAGAEGIAQLMPQYYAGVDRTDPQASLIAGAQTMRDYLGTHDGDLRKALASYNAGLGRVQESVQRYGTDWERGLPQETQHYLAAILGGAAPTVRIAGAEG